MLLRNLSKGPEAGSCLKSGERLFKKLAIEKASKPPNTISPI
jgi:hypothetical protein